MRKLRRAVARARAHGAYALGTLSAAALAIPGLANLAEAQTAPGEGMVRLSYGHYQDYQDDWDDRMRIQVPMMFARVPLGERWEAEGSFVIDSMSGASPLFLSALSGASGRGIHDTRRAGDLKLTRYFERFKVAGGAFISTEDDYDSAGGLVEGTVWTSDRNTFLSAGYSYANDNIGSTNNPDLSEDLRTHSFLFGVTQVIDPVSIFQINLTYETQDGYLDDPYKNYEHRPRSRDQWAALARYRRYLQEWRSALHLDYRLYYDSWNVVSHTAESALYIEVADSWIVRPSLRYYSQREASFFTDEIPPLDIYAFRSADYRLASFGALAPALKVIYSLGDGWSVDGKAELYVARPEWKLGGGGTDALERFFATIYTMGLTKVF